jgi:cell division protein ZapB
VDAELKVLEEKVGQLAALCHRLRADNHDLRQQLASALNDKDQLGKKVGDAATRLETLLTQISDDEA